MNAPSADADYPFNARWKAAVDHDGLERMHYCEAAELVKRCIQTQKQRGQDAAIQETLASCDTFRAQGEERVTTLKTNFRFVWKHKKSVLNQASMS